MNKYLAKSYGELSSETIVEHTQNLLRQFQLFKSEYPNALSDQDWQLLKIACQYHDLGKMNAKFQTKLHDKHKMEDGEVPHGLLSVSLIPIKLLKQKGFSKIQLKALCYAIALHHDRNLDGITDRQYQREIELLKKEAANFPFTELGLPESIPRKQSKQYYTLNHYLKPNDKSYLEYVLIKGLLNRTDFAASGHYEVESVPRVRLEKNVLKTWQKKNSNASWNDLQEWSGQHQNENIVVIGQTGLGKTEAALRWLGNDKGFFLLPLRSAINAIFQRFSSDYQLDSEHLALLHSDMMSFLIDKESKHYQEIKMRGFDRLVNESRQLSKQLTVATLDQLFNFVYHYQGYEPKLATLSYSKVVIDEIQKYSPALLAYILYGLRLIQDYGGHFEVMTATLAPFILDLMDKYGFKFTQPEQPFFNQNLLQRHSIKVEHQQASAEEVLKYYHSNKVLVVCNTINKAEKVYDELKKTVKNLHLIHSRFIRQDRLNLENKICEFGKTTSDETGIWIGTQVVEASLDIDFDILITELSELNSLFQRMGRCYRKRQLKDNSYNVYVFDGGDEDPSGIGKGETSVFDYGMYTLTKQVLKSIDGPLSEKKKISLINNTYTMENLQRVSPDYVNEINGTIDYLKATVETPPTKAEVTHRFRSINSITVIPEQIVEENSDLIDSSVRILNGEKKFNNTDEQRKCRIFAKMRLNQFTLSIPLWMAGKANCHLVYNDRLEKCGYHVLGKGYRYNHDRGLSTSYIKDDDNNLENIF